MATEISISTLDIDEDDLAKDYIHIIFKKDATNENIRILEISSKEILIWNIFSKYSF